MAVKVGGMYTSRLSTQLANEMCAQLRALNGPVDFDDFVVDLCLMTYVAGGLGSEYAAGTGIRPGMVGRKQRRFTINLEVPPDLANGVAYRSWIAEALGEAALITRDHLPGKSRSYPAERLAGEIEALRDRWIEQAIPLQQQVAGS